MERPCIRLECLRDALVLAFLFGSSNKEKKGFRKVDESNHILATNHA